MRGLFAALMAFAHCAGMVGMALVVTLWNFEKGGSSVLVEATSLSVVGFFLSLLVFVPVWIVAIFLAPIILKHRLLFVLLGPVAVTSAWIGFSGTLFLEHVAISTSLSSLVLFLFWRWETFREVESGA